MSVDQYIAANGGFDAALALARKDEADPEILARLEAWNKHRKGCGICGAYTQLSELRDITCAGDWHTACLTCADKFRDKPEKRRVK